MTKIKLILLIVATAATFSFVPEQADAQKNYRPVKRFHRWLGIYHNHGYHYRNPGPDVSYYNPYNAHNSRLIGQNYNSSYGNAGNRQGYGVGSFGYGNGYSPNNNMYNPTNYGNTNQYSSPKPSPKYSDDDGDDYDDEPDPAARPVDSSIEGEVESLDDLDADESLSPGADDSTLLPIDTDSEIMPASTPSIRTPDPYWDNQPSSRGSGTR